MSVLQSDIASTEFVPQAVGAAEVVLDADLGPAIKKHLCMVHVKTSRWTGRVMSKGAKIEMPADDHTIISVPAEAMTKPCHKLDIHPVFKLIDATAKVKAAIVLKYGVSCDEKGFSLVSMSKVANMIVELCDVRAERLRVIREELVPRWDTEIADSIRAVFPNHYGMVLSKMPKADSLQDKFDLTWSIRPLTPFSGADIDVSELDPAMQWKVIEESNRMLAEKSQEQVDKFYDVVWGEVITLVDKINEGSLETGARKAGAMTDMLKLLDRMENFSDVTPKDILDKLAAAKGVIKGVGTVQKLNANGSMQLAIKNAMSPLGDALREMQEKKPKGPARAARSLVM